MKIAWHSTPAEDVEAFGPPNGSIVVCAPNRVAMHVFYSRMQGWEVARAHADPLDEEDESRFQDTCQALLSSSLPNHSEHAAFEVNGTAGMRIGSVLDALGDMLRVPQFDRNARLTGFWLSGERHVAFGEPSGIVAYVRPDGKHHVHMLSSQQQAWRTIMDAVWIHDDVREAMMRRVALSALPLEGPPGPTVNGYTAALLSGAFELATHLLRLPAH